MELPDELVHKVRSKTNLLVVFLSPLQLAKDIFNTKRVSVNVDVDVSSGNVEHGDHLSNVFRNFERVNVSRGLKSVAAFFRPPRVF